MDVRVERKIEVSKWIIKTRWFYIFGIYLIGVLINSVSKSIVDFPYFTMFVLVFVFVVFNYIFSKAILKIEKKPSFFKINFLGIFQILIELVIFTIIMHLSGSAEGVAFVYFFIPILSSSLIFGVLGSALTAFASGVFVNLLVVAEFNGFVGHVSRYGVDTLENSDISFAITKTLTVAIMFLIVGLLAGYSSSLLLEREKELLGKNKVLDEEKKKRSEELNKIDKTANLLLERDVELSKINNELDQKIAQLEDAEKSQMRAFRDLKLARKTTEEEKEKTDAIISNFIDPIIVLNKERKIMLMNPSARETFALTSEALGKKISKKDNYSLNNFKEIINFEYTVKNSEELKIEDDSIEELSFSVSEQVITYKVITAEVTGKRGEFYGTMKIFYNLTREKMVDKLKSEFISVAAHQLRTPLSAIKWVIKMVLDGDAGKLNEEQADLLTKGYKSNERIIGLVNDMLNVSRIDEGRFGYNFEKGDFNDVLDYVVSNLEPKIANQHLKFHVEKPDDLPELYLDRNKMTMVFQNLLENAVKYTPDNGSVWLKVEVSKKFIEIRVKDNGVGIPKKDQEKLFSKFFRAENVVRMQTEGSGLGLFIVKNVVEKHGGTITFESEEGKGTEFIIKLPIDNKNN